MMDATRLFVFGVVFFWVKLVCTIPTTVSEPKAEALKDNSTDLETLMRLSQLTRYFFQGPLSIFQPAYQLPTHLLPNMTTVKNFSQFGRATRVELPKPDVKIVTLSPPPSRRTDRVKTTLEPKKVVWDTTRVPEVSTELLFKAENNQKELVVKVPRKDSRIIKLLSLKFSSNAKPIGVVINGNN